MIIVDGSHLLHKSLLAPGLNELSDHNNNSTGGIHGFLNSLSYISNKYRYRKGLLVCWDSGISVYKRKINRNYKPKKNFVKEFGMDIDESLLSDINKQYEETGVTVDAETGTFLEKYRFSRSMLHNSILPYCGCLSIRVPNCEADDIISVLVNKLKKEDDIIIFSSDRDLNQLLDEGVIQFDGLRKEPIITKEDIIQKFELNENDWRKQWIYTKALIGDPSDNIKGFYKLGEKAAIFYARQILENNITDFTKLEKCPRTPEEGLNSLIKDSHRFWDNIKLIDLNYIMDNKEPLYNRIIENICKSNIFDIDEMKVREKLNEFQLKKSLVFAQNVIEANYNYDTKKLIKKFL